MPEGTIKKRARRLVRWARSWLPSRFNESYVSELVSLEVADAGTSEDGTPYVTLSDGSVFFGADPVRSRSESFSWYQDDLAAYGHLPAVVREKIPPECIRVALDVILRYKYPHATPDITPPYPVETRRRFWFGQHSDTIDDFDNLSAQERAALKEQFRLRTGDVVVDVGACYGFGALRYSRMVGPEGRVIAVEADPVVQELFVRNMEANGASNVDLERCGVWSEPGELSLFVGSIHRQDSSLRQGIYDSDESVTVPTRTIDDIVESRGIDRLDLVSVSVNTAEVEALLGMDGTLKRFKPNLSLAGWLLREDDVLVHEVLHGILAGYPGYRVAVGRTGRVLAWHRDGERWPVRAGSSVSSRARSRTTPREP